MSNFMSDEVKLLLLIIAILLVVAVTFLGALLYCVCSIMQTL